MNLGINQMLQIIFHKESKFFLKRNNQKYYGSSQNNYNSDSYQNAPNNFQGSYSRPADGYRAQNQAGNPWNNPKTENSKFSIKKILLTLELKN